MELRHFKQAMEQFAANVVIEARQNLDEPAKKLEVKAKWDKHGNRWVATRSNKRTLKRKTSNTGNLSRSIQYEVSDNKIVFSMLGYGETVEEGRKPNSLRGVPERDLVKWLKRKGKDEDLYFQINRKIKYFGIPPTEFFSRAVEEEFKELEVDIYEALEKDFDEYFSEVFEKLL